MGNRNKNLHRAKRAKNDEFYTQRVDIDNELQHYEKHFAGKVVYCNCDKQSSNFVKYFHDNYKRLGLKHLMYTSVDFRSQASIDRLKKADIVVTNPPFSLFREYVAQLVKYDKQFLIIGNKNAITYKEIFPLLKDEKVCLVHRCQRGLMYRMVMSLKLLKGWLYGSPILIMRNAMNL